MIICLIFLYLFFVIDSITYKQNFFEALTKCKEKQPKNISQDSTVFAIGINLCTLIVLPQKEKLKRIEKLLFDFHHVQSKRKIAQKVHL